MTYSEEDLKQAVEALNNVFSAPEDCIPNSSNLLAARLLSDVYQRRTLKDFVPTVSHTEADILKGCFCLMSQLVDDMLDYMDFKGFQFDPSDPEDAPYFAFPAAEVVRTLFLSKTRHSGGTSTRTKCRELGIDPYQEIVFKKEEG